MSISILILTRNEELDLPGCLASVSWCDDVVIYDSCSSDATAQIATAAGARVVQRPGADGAYFGGNEADHRNWGLRNIAFKHPWVFQLDADERMSAALVEESGRAVANAGSNAAFRVRRRDFLFGTWLKHVQASPYYLRLFRPERLHYERLINPVSVVDGDIGHVEGHLDHYPFSKGMSHWLARHNSYSSLEAQQIIANRQVGGSFSWRDALFASDFHTRRYHQKELFYRLPLRPLVKFLILYIGKRGFLDGRAGLTYAVLQSIYEYFIVLKTAELERGERH